MDQLHSLTLEIRLCYIERKEEIRTALLYDKEQIRLCRQKKFKDNGNEDVKNKALTHRSGTL
jgi:hypothetical protein